VENGEPDRFADSGTPFPELIASALPGRSGLSQYFLLQVL
jgi:hypothetical protein